MPGFGCHIGHECCSVLGTAVDISLLAPMSALQKMLLICEDFVLHFPSQTYFIYMDVKSGEFISGILTYLWQVIQKLNGDGIMTCNLLEHHGDNAIKKSQYISNFLVFIFER